MKKSGNHEIAIFEETKNKFIMLKQINQEDILFLDIETVPQFPDFGSAPVALQTLWEKKFSTLSNTACETAAEAWPRSGIYAEFGKVVCISTACYRAGALRLTSFAGRDEIELLTRFAEMLEVHFHSSRHLLCAHNGKEFDFPYLSRRMLVNGIPLPAILDSAGLKPWQVRHIDTMELWKFGDHKSYTSLELLTYIFGIPSPKEDICGADVWKVFWKEDDPDRIRRYCEQDTLALVNIFRRYQGKQLLGSHELILV